MGIGSDGFGESFRSDLALILGVVFQGGVFDAHMVLALIVTARNRVARERWNCPFKTCSKAKTTKEEEEKKNISVTSIFIHVFPYSLGVTKHE